MGPRGRDETTTVGTTARIVDFNALPDGLLGLLLGEQQIFSPKHWQQDDGLHRRRYRVRGAEEAADLPGEYQHLGELLRKVLPELGDLYANVPKHFSRCHVGGLPACRNPADRAVRKAVLPGARRPDREARKAEPPIRRSDE